MKSETDFFFLGTKITVDGHIFHEIRQLFLSRKAMTNLDSVLKSRDITLLTKIHIVKAMAFIGSSDAEADAPILWLPDVKS